jgi:hypothetical protein
MGAPARRGGRRGRPAGITRHLGFRELGEQICRFEPGVRVCQPHQKIDGWLLPLPSSRQLPEVTP